MGSFVFKWEHAASEVYVTGTFDGWKKTEKLNKVGEHFEKQVQLDDASEKIYYKFVVDGNWVTDHTAPKETDESGNENNVLTPERIVKAAPATTAIMSSAAPDSTTAALAASAPLENNRTEEKEYKTEGLPGVFPETPALDLNKQIGINPLPAAPGAVNPVQLAPGEKIPEHITAESTTSHVKLDPESYEKADTLPAGGFAAFSSAAPTSTTAELAAGAPIETTKVPAVVKESQEKAHVDPEASAIPEEVEDKADVEKELLNRVKEAPSTSEGTAGVGTEKTESTVTAGEAAAAVAAAATALGGAAIAGAVAAKNYAVEKAPVVASTAQESAAQAATTAQPYIASASETAQQTATQAAANLPETVKAQLPESVQSSIYTASKENTIQAAAPTVPIEVRESLAEAGQSPEAAASVTAVQDKKAVENELLREVNEVKPIAAVGGASHVVPAEPLEPVQAVPVEVRDSLAAAHQSPEAASSASAVEDKKAVEKELLKEVSPVAAVPTASTSTEAKAEPITESVQATPDNALSNAEKTVAEPKSETAPASTLAGNSGAQTDKSVADVPESKTETEPKSILATETAPDSSLATETEPKSTAANGAGAQATTAAPATPAKSNASSSKAADSPATTEKKKKNRISAFFGKLKEKAKK